LWSPWSDDEGTQRPHRNRYILFRMAAASCATPAQLARSPGDEESKDEISAWGWGKGLENPPRDLKTPAAAVLRISNYLPPIASFIVQTTKMSVTRLRFCHFC
jgi:hypothetical protein